MSADLVLYVVGSVVCAAGYLLVGRAVRRAYMATRRQERPR